MKAALRQMAVIAWYQGVGVILVIMGFLAYRAWFDPVGETFFGEWIFCVLGGQLLGSLVYLLRTRKQRRIARNIAAAQRLKPPPNPRDLARHREPHRVEPFEDRLTQYAHHNTPDRHSADDDFRSTMPFWSSETWFVQRAPKSVAYTRAMLRRIKRYLAC